MYIFTYCLLGCFAFDDLFLKKGKYYLLLIAIAVLWLIFHDGFRWGIATDWDTYHNYFLNCLDDSNPDNFEPGYVLLNQLVYRLTDNYSVFLVIHAIIVYSLITRSIINYSPYPLYSFFLFYCLMLSYLGMNRQYISFVMAIYAYKYILDKKLLYFLLCVAIGFLFHKSIILFVPAYWLTNRISNRVLIIVFFIALFISLSGIINKLPLNLFLLAGSDVGDKVSFYSDTYTLTTNPLFTIAALLKRSIWVILALGFRHYIKNIDKRFDFFFNLYFIGNVIYIMFNNTILQIIVARGILYFNIAEIFLIPYLITIFKKDVTRYIAFFLIAVYGWLTINKGINFYKEDLGKDIFSPYNSVLFDDKYNAMEDGK